MENNITISCIIPVYNVGKYVYLCLESIVKANYSSVEIIIINDASKDDTAQELDRFCSNYKEANIKVINNEVQLGVSISRNKGVSVATGDLIHFIDGDDEILPDLYSEIAKLGLANIADVTIFNYYKRSKLKNKICDQKKDISLNYATSLPLKLEVLKKGVTVWNKIFKKDFLIKNNLFFVPSTIYEDIPFFWQTVVKAKSIKYLDVYGYIYYTREFSIMNSKLSIDKTMQMANVWLFVYRFLENENVYEDFKPLFTDKCLKTIIEFHDKTITNKKYIYYRMVKFFSFLYPKNVHKGILSKRKIIKYKIFLSGNYYLYRIFFAVFKLFKI